MREATYTHWRQRYKKKLPSHYYTTIVVFLAYHAHIAYLWTSHGHLIHPYRCILSSNALTRLRSPLKTMRSFISLSTLLVSVVTPWEVLAENWGTMCVDSHMASGGGCAIFAGLNNTCGKWYTKSPLGTLGVFKEACIYLCV